MPVLLDLLLLALASAQEAPPAVPPVVGTLLTVRAGLGGPGGTLATAEGRRLLEASAASGGALLAWPVHPSAVVRVEVELAPGAALTPGHGLPPVLRRAEQRLATLTREVSARRAGALGPGRSEVTSLTRHDVVGFEDRGGPGGALRRILTVERLLEVAGAPHRLSWSRRDGLETDPFDRLEAAADPELIGLLPGRPVAVGETWQLGEDAARAALLPAGEIGLPFPGAKADALGWYPTLATVLRGEARGEGLARLVALGEDDGLRLAEVELELALEVVADLGAHFASHPPTDGSGAFSTRRVDSDWLFEGTGRLLWNLDAGRYHSLAIEGQVTQRYDFHYLVSGEDHELRQEVSGHLAVGLIEVKAPATEEPPPPPVVPPTRTPRGDDR